MGLILFGHSNPHIMACEPHLWPLLPGSLALMAARAAQPVNDPYPIRLWVPWDGLISTIVSALGCFLLCFSQQTMLPHQTANLPSWAITLNSCALNPRCGVWYMPMELSPRARRESFYVPRKFLCASLCHILAHPYPAREVRVLSPLCTACFRPCLDRNSWLSLLLSSEFSRTLPRAKISLCI